MTLERAKKILDPETSSEAYIESEYYGGFSAKEHWKQEVDEACKIAVDAIEKQIPKYAKCPKGFRGIRDTRFYCPACNSLTRQREKWCHKCGQAVKYPKAIYREKENRIVLDWSDTE